MGVYIKGMEMPTDRPLIIKISPDGTVYMSQGIYGIGHGVATAVPVPPHGRLIDADEFLKNTQLQRCFRGDYALLLNDVIEECATIIPSEDTE